MDSDQVGFVGGYEVSLCPRRTVLEHAHDDVVLDKRSEINAGREGREPERNAAKTRILPPAAAARARRRDPMFGTEIWGYDDSYGLTSVAPGLRPRL